LGVRIAEPFNNNQTINVFSNPTIGVLAYSLYVQKELNPKTSIYFKKTLSGKIFFAN